MPESGRERVTLTFAIAFLLFFPVVTRADHTALLRSVHSGKCVQIAGASTADGADAEQSACDFGDDQKIYFDPAASTAGVFELTPLHSGKCLEVVGDDLAAGARVEQVPCDNGANQHWELIPAPSGTYEIAAAHSGLLLSLASVSTADGISLVQEADTDADHQRWFLANADNRDPSIYGAWSDVKPWPHIPVSGANLPDGRLLTFSGSERETWPTTEFTYSATWDPSTEQIVEISHQSHNMFCAHLAMMEDGQVFVNGGRNQTNSPWASLFDYVNDQWIPIRNMATGGRWYPTTVALTDGDMFTAVGTATNQRNPERWDSIDGWKILTGIDFQVPILDYEATHGEHRWWSLLNVAPQGKLFHSGPLPTVGWINTSGTGSYEDTGIRLTDWYHKHGSTLMYDRGKIITAGGWVAGNNTGSSAKAMTIDLNGPLPSIQNIDPMNHPRKFHNGILLPTGEVLMVGGNTSGAKFNDNGTVYVTEFWNPTTGMWRDGAAMTIPRNYHSIGLLLPDGRVFAGGGGYCSGSRYCSGASHPDAEVYSPPYLFAPGGGPAVRPTIDAGPGLIDNGELFDVQVSGVVDHFSMIKMAATTHGLTTDVRYLRIASQDLGAGVHRLTVDGNPNVLTPGYWMIFALDPVGVPSEAHIVRVGNLDVRFENVAPAGGASQSSDASSAYPVGAANATDGDMSGTEMSGSLALTGAETQPWWEIDLFSSYNLDSIRLWNRTDCCSADLSDLYVLVSDSPILSTNLATARAQAGVTEYYVGPEVSGQLELAIGRSGRFVRVQLAGSTPLGLAEVQIFGDSPGAGTAGLVHYSYYQGAFSAVPDFSTMTPLREGTVDGFRLTPKTDDQDYAFRFHGRLSVPTSGIYDFYTESDDGSLLWIDGLLVVDNDGVHTQQEQQGSVALTAGDHDIMVGHFQQAGADFLRVRYSGPGIPKQSIPVGALALMPDGGGSGTIQRDWWTGISGTLVDYLTGDPGYPGSPDGSDERPLFEAPINWANDYGTRMHGYLYPPFSGEYTFWVSSDDAGELWLSTDDDPANAVKIAEVPGWSNSRQWDKFAQQQSATITLQSGRRYFIEALHKEGGGGDHLAVAWATPLDGRQVIDGADLSPPYEKLEIVTVSAPPQVVSAPVAMSATVSGEGVTHSWSFGDGSPDTNFAPSNATSHSFPGPGRYSVTLTVKDIHGNQKSTVFQQLVHAPLTGGKPNASSTIVFHDGRAEVWNVNPDNDTVSVIDANLGVLVAEIPVNAEPRALTVAHDGRVWVACKHAATIDVIDPATMTVDLSLPTGRGSRPGGIVAARSAAVVYVTLEATGELIKLDASSGSELDRNAIADNVRGISISADEATLLVSQFITPPATGEHTGTPDIVNAAGRVHRVATADLSLLGTTTLKYSDRLVSEHTGPGLPNYVQTAVISPSGDGAWVPSKQDNIGRGLQRDGFALTHDQTVRAITSRVLLPGGTEQFSSRIDHDNASIASAAAFGPWGLHVYTALEGNRQVVVSDTYLGSELLRFDVGRAPQGIAISPSGNMLYVHNFMDRTVTFVDVMDVSQQGDLNIYPLADVSVVTAETLSPQILRGKQHFYDARDDRLAAESYMACAACHNAAGQDGRVWDFTDVEEGLRNTVLLEGHGAGQGLQHWTGNFDEIQDFENQIRNAAGGFGLMDDVDFTATEPILGPPKTGLSYDLDALAAYVHSLSTPPVSPFQDPGPALTAEAEAGRLLFQSEACNSCHSGPEMTDSATGLRHDVGTIKPSSGQRLGGTLDGFDTPSLLGLWHTAPYLHDGSAPDIASAILAHNVTSGLNATELDQLAAYLTQVEAGDGVAQCASVDNDCDGFDDDCDGTPDDDYIPAASVCGRGGCAGSVGALLCNAGVLVDTCDPFLGALPEVCDGTDNDCNGVVDEGISPTPTACGDGVCASAGEMECIGGLLTDSCVAGAPTGLDDECDGLDQDCTGVADDRYLPPATACGVGECAGNAGLLVCNAGVLTDTCDPLAGSVVEDSCDLLDNDCNGTVDDGADDSDGDFLGDACDCAPLDPANPDPAPVGATLYVNRMVPAGTSETVWQAPLDPDVYNVYRGQRISGDPWSYNQQCFGEAVAATAMTDPEVPLPGALFYYVVSSACSIGTSESGVGQDSSGSERPLPDACE